LATVGQSEIPECGGDRSVDGGRQRIGANRPPDADMSSAECGFTVADSGAQPGFPRW